MAVQFILGRAGSGKTYSCLEAIRAQLRLSQRGPALVLLVPEQATYQTERALVTTSGLGGYCRAHVLSFRRLAYQVLMEVGGAALPPLEASGKQMALRSILRRRSADLRLFEKSARQRGFIERLAATLVEMRSYGHRADRLRAELALLEQRGEGESLLAAKMHDLATVVEEYERFLAERYVDPDSYLDLLVERLPKNNSFHSGRIWIDGFASFTGQEERVLGALMRVAAEMKIALCLDPQMGGGRQEARGEKQEEGVREDETSTTSSVASRFSPLTSSTDLSMFELLHETYQRLHDLAQSSGQLILPPRILPESDQPTRFSKSPVLAHLEQHLFAPGRAGCQPTPFGNEVHPQSEIRSPIRPRRTKIQNSVVLTVAADQRCEVRDVACEILRLCREEGYRFREIAVVVRDLTPYRTLIETIFPDYEIPHFIDIRHDVAHHPLVELVRSALAVVRGWRSQDVIRYAKTDLVSVNHGQSARGGRAAIDQLENYVLEHGVEGEAWYRPEPWRFQYRRGVDEEGETYGGEASPDRITGRMPVLPFDTWRQSLVGPLRKLDEEASQENATVLDISRAFYRLLEGIGVADRLEQWAGEAEREGRLTEADEHRQVWDAVMDLLDQAVAALGNEPVGLDEYREIIEAGLEGIRLRLVPPALDQVLVGSIERSRHPEIRAAFVLGLNERVFPRQQMPDVIFGDPERERLARDGLLLGPVSEKRLVHEQFLAYIAFTRPSERLYVSYAEADPMGKALHPSPYVSELKRCLPDLEVRRAERDEPLDRVAHWRAALAALAAGLRAGSAFSLRPTALSLQPTWIALYGAMRRDGRWCEALGRRVGGLAYENRAKLRLPVARRLYDIHAESSVSRLECFAACPFKHFARYGLALEERLRFRLEYFDLGLLYHAVLKDVFGQISGGKPLDWADVEASQAVKAVEEAIERKGRQLRNEIFLSSGRNRYLLDSARAALTTFVQVLIAASRRDGFHQAAAEVSFGRGEGNPYGPLEIALVEDKRLLLRGRIDRIDVGDEMPTIVRIIDYKSRYKRFQPNELAHGLTLQLPTYLLAVERGLARQGKPPTVAGALYVPILRGMRTAAPSQAIPPPGDNLESEIRNSKSEMPGLAAWKARGLFDFQWAGLFDAEVKATGGRSPVVALAVKQNGEPYSWDSHDALPDGTLGDLLRWTERKLADLGKRILSGEVAVLPYLLGNERACTWCEFGAVCRFDGQREPYRPLESRSRTRAIEWIREQVGG